MTRKGRLFLSRGRAREERKLLTSGPVAELALRGAALRCVRLHRRVQLVRVAKDPVRRALHVVVLQSRNGQLNGNSLLVPK